MDNLNLNKHISGQFNAELESIRTQVMTMGGMVEQQLSDAITAMHNQDSELAKRVVDGDKHVNMMEVAIDEACVRIIAKRQPTASDLRLVMAIIKTIAELERIGDVADKICRTALEKFSQQHQPLLVSPSHWGVTPYRCCTTCWMRLRGWIWMKQCVSTVKTRKWTRIRRDCASADDLYDGRFAYDSQCTDCVILCTLYRAYRRPLPEYLRIHLLLREGPISVT